MQEGGKEGTILESISLHRGNQGSDLQTLTGEENEVKKRTLKGQQKNLKVLSKIMEQGKSPSRNSAQKGGEEKGVIRPKAEDLGGVASEALHCCGAKGKNSSSG